MKIYNQEKTGIIENPDLKKGYLQSDRIVSKTIPAVEAVEEQFHYEYKEYPNGGRDRIKVVDVPAVETKEESYEYEDIQVYIPYTAEELMSIRLTDLENWFNNYFDKQLTQSQWQDDFTISHDDYFDKDYANIDELKVQAKVVRNEIRRLREEFINKEV